MEDMDKFCKSCGKSSNAKRIEAEKEDQKATPYIEKTTKTSILYHPLIQSRLFWVCVAILFIGYVFLSSNETRYETVYSGTLSDTGLTTKSWSFEKADYYTQEFTGNDLWGKGEYKFRVCWTGVTCKDYYEINAWNINKDYKSVTKARIDWIRGR